MLKYITALFISVAFLPALVCAQWQYHPIDIPMRDGQTLAADVYTTDTTAAKPVILIQTPYNKALYRLSVDAPQLPARVVFPLDTNAYNYVAMDWRGRYASTGALQPGQVARIGEDGYDAVEWIATQPWCNGKIGTWGASALGDVQFKTATQQPPHLVCCVPLVIDFKAEYSDYYYGGVFRREQIEGLMTLQFITTTGLDYILSHPSYDLVWKLVETASDSADKIQVPMLMIGGWFDHYPDNVLRAFNDLQTKSDATVRSQHKLIFGPWLHGSCIGAEQGILTFENASTTAETEALQFFAYYLNDADNNWHHTPPVQYYQLGENIWNTEEAWPPGSTTDLSMYLAADSVLQSSPEESAHSVSFLYDPRDPSPSIGSSRFTPGVTGTPAGPQDTAPIEARSDNVIFTSQELQNDLLTAGPISVELYVSSNRTDTDIAVRICDVYPDGTSVIMADGIHRMRYRNSLSTPELMTPGNVYPVTVSVQNIAITFQKGHRLRLIITSSDYPRFDINTNTGGELYIAGDTLTAENTISFGAEYPSRIVFQQKPVSPVQTLSSIPETISMDVYPHPAHTPGYLRIHTTEPSDARIHIYDISGKWIETVYDGTMPSGENTYALPAMLSPGMYYIVLTSGNRMRRSIPYILY